jgi:plastocyanin
MRRTWLLAAVLAAGCGNSEKVPERQAKPAAEGPKPVEYFHPDAATAATLTGTVVFRGTRPPRRVMSMDSEEGCQKLHSGKPVYDEPVLTGKSGGLANVFVYIKDGLGDKKFEPPKDPVVIDQRGCLFEPRVLGLRPGQTLDLKNSDPVSHNIHPMPQNNREWNEQQSPGTPDAQHRFARAEVMIPVKCNVHSWMHAWIGVVDHPYFAVTGPDGRFEFKNVPPGDYTIACWHEKLGEQKEQVHLDASGTAALHFTYR